MRLDLAGVASNSEGLKAEGPKGIPYFGTEEIEPRPEHHDQFRN